MAGTTQFSPFNSVYLEITGKCNARCPWCERGARNIGTLPPLDNEKRTKFIDPAYFSEIMDHVLQKGIISSDATIALHNWG